MLSQTLKPRMRAWIKGPIHFVGIGGIGMSAIATVLYHMGIQVQGSDVHASAAWKRLKELGIPVWEGHHADYILGAGVVVVSAAINACNPEVQAANGGGIPVIGRWQMLAELMQGQWSIGVAGSHGKTTVTSLMGRMWECAGLDPTLITGGVVNAYGSNARRGESPWIIAETDESDGSFTKLPVLFGVVTNISGEHMGFFKTEAALDEAFARFLENLPFYGAAAVCADHPRVRAIASRLGGEKRLLPYGCDATTPLYARAANITWGEKGMVFDVHWADAPAWEHIHINLWGEHNVLNALAVMSLGRFVGISEAVQREALSSFEGVKRRLSLVGCVKGITIWDDYAHHPIEIMAVLKTIRHLCKGRLIAVCQPHRYSRLKALLEDFYQSLSYADRVVLLPVYSAGEPYTDIDSTSLYQMMIQREVYEENLTPLSTMEAYDRVKDSIAYHSTEETLGQQYTMEGAHKEPRDVHLCEGFSHATRLLKEYAKPEDAIVCMGAGTITYFASDLLQSLQEGS